MYYSYACASWFVRSKIKDVRKMLDVKKLDQIQHYKLN